MATVQMNLATDSTQMANDFGKWPQFKWIWPQFLRKWPHMPKSKQSYFKTVIKCIGRDGNNQLFFPRDGNVVESYDYGIKNSSQSLPKISDVWINSCTNGRTMLLRLRFLTFDQTPSTFPCSLCFPYLRIFATVLTLLFNQLGLFFLKIDGVFDWKLIKAFV